MENLLFTNKNIRQCDCELFKRKLVEAGLTDYNFIVDTLQLCQLGVDIFIFRLDGRKKLFRR